MAAARTAAPLSPTAAPALLAALLLAAVGCTGSADGSSDPPPSSRPSYGTVFLDTDECASRGRVAVREVPCTSERAAAGVLVRHFVPRADGPRCPERTDYVLRISDTRSPGATGTATAEADAAGTTRAGYACMRALDPPHPGDPGMGGGPLTIVGDCVYSTDDGGRVHETACDGSGRHEPEFEIVSAVPERPDCPERTSLYVGLGGDLRVGCARRL